MNPLIKYGELQKEVFVEVHCSDIHFGNSSTDVATHFQIMNEQFLDVIKDVPYDILSINGDLFDHKGMTNSDMTMYAAMFVDRVVCQCREKGATLVLLEGTGEHDADQLKIFYHYLDDPTVDVRIIERAQFEIIKGKRILYLPEEYNKGHEYYENLFYRSGFYDAAYFHGTLAGSVYGCNFMDLDGTRAVFDLPNFCFCAGPIIGGHVHRAQCIQGYMYYTGNPVRYKFGEEEAKGFTILLHNLRNRMFYTHFQEIKSFRYDTVNLDAMLQDDPKNVVNYIKQLQANGIDNIRVEFTVDHVAIKIIQDALRNNSKIKFNLDKIKKVAKQEKLKADEQLFEEKYQGLEFLLDQSISEYDKLTKFINHELGYAFITTDELIELLEEI